MKVISKNILPPAAAGGAALFSVLTGLISGVSAGSLLIRAFLFALMAGGFIILAQWLIKTYLPELVNLGNEGGETNSPGDISPVNGADTVAESTGQTVNIVMSDSEDEGLSPVSAASPVRPEGVDNLEIAENVKNVHNNKPDDSDNAAGAEGLDSLPNLDSLEISMGSSSENMDSSESAPAMDSMPASAGVKAEVKMSEHGDPAEIAKAVKTVLARDQQK